MDPILEKKLISTKDAGELSGYSPDYLSRLARSGKIDGKRIGHSWLINQESLERFISLQNDHKIDYSRALARAREAEYRAHNSTVRTVARVLSKPISAPKIGIFHQVLHSQALAFGISVLVVASGAYVANATSIPESFEQGIEIARDAASGFKGTFGWIPEHIASRVNVAGTQLQNAPRLSAKNIRKISSRIALHQIRIDAGFARVENKFSLQPPKLNFYTFGKPEKLKEVLRVITVADIKRDVIAAFAFISSPSRIALTCASLYRFSGEEIYAFVVNSFATYQSLIEQSGEFAFDVSAYSRDFIIRSPSAISSMNLALGSAVQKAANTSVSTETSLIYGISGTVLPNVGKAARSFAQYQIGIGAGLAEATSVGTIRAPIATVSALRGMSEAVSLLASAIFNAEYAGASHFVAATDAISKRYLSSIASAGIAVADVTGADPLGSAAEALAYMRGSGPHLIQNAYLSVVGKIALAFDSIVRMPNIANGLAAVSSNFSAGERAALATYQTIHGIFEAAAKTLASLTAPPPAIVMPSLPPNYASTKTLAVATSMENRTGGSAVPATSGTYTSYPTYTTVVRGVSEDFVNKSLASLKTDLLATMSGMVRPVAQQTATNATTIQYVNMIQKLDSLAVTNGTFTDSTFDSGVKVSARDGSFTNLTVSSNATLASTTIAGPLTLTGNQTTTGNISVTGTLAVTGAVTSDTSVAAPYFSATSTSATSTFAGHMAIGTTSPFAYAMFTVGTSSPLLHIDSNTGFAGFGTSSPSVELSVAGSGYLTSGLGIGAVNTSAGSILATATTTAFNFIASNRGTAGAPAYTYSGDLDSGFWSPAANTLAWSTNGLERMRIDSSGNIGIGTTTTDSLLSLQQITNGVPFISAYRVTDTAPSGDFINYKTKAGTTLFRVDNSGNLLAGGIINSGSETITSTSQPQLRVQYDASNEWTLSVGATGTTTIAMNGTAPGLVFTPQSNLINTFNFTDASSNSILSIDTTNRRVGIGTTSPAYTLSVEGASTLGNQVYAGYYIATTSTASTLPYASTTAITVASSANLASLAGASVSSLTTNYVPKWNGGTFVNSIISDDGIHVNFSYASTTQLSALNSLAIGTTSTTTISGDGTTSTIYGPLLVRGTSDQAGSLTIQRGNTSGNSTLTFNDQTGTALLQIYNDIVDNNGYGRIVGRQLYLTFGTLNGGTALSIDTNHNIDVTSNIIPTTNQQYNLGSAERYWNNGYIHNIVANNLSSASTSIAGTNNVSFSIYSNNPTVDATDISLIFYRGAGAPSNGVLSWDATDKRFEFNQNLYVANGTGATSSTTLKIAAINAQTGALTSWLDSSGNVLDTITANGNLGLGITPSASYKLEVNGIASSTSLVLGNALAVQYGGTGSTSLTAGGLLYGSGTNPIQTIATTSAALGLGLIGTLTTLNNTTQSLSIATSSLYTGATGGLPYFSNTNTLSPLAIGTAGYVLSSLNGVPTWTATTTFSAPLAYANGAVSIAAANGTTNGYLSSTDWTTFNNKIASTSLSASFPLAYNSSTGVFAWNGLATSTTAVVGNIPYFSGVNTFANVATSSATLGLGLTGSLTTIGTSQSLSIATSSLYTGTTGQFPYFSGTNTLTATSSVYLATSGNVGIGTTNPGSLLDLYIENATTPAALLLRSKDTAVGSPPFSAIEFQTSSTGNVSGTWHAAKIVAGFDGENYADARLTFQYPDVTGTYTDAMTIKNGNVGIGTTGPNITGAGTALTIKGTSARGLLELVNSSTGTSGIAGDIEMYNGTTFIASIDGAADGATNKGMLRFWTNKAGTVTEQMRIDNQGNVGIGTTSPSAKLDVWDGNLMLSDTDVVHGFTDWTANTAAYGRLGPLSGTAGGLLLTAFSDSDATGLNIVGLMGSTNPTDATPAIIINGAKQDGTTYAAMGASETVLQIKTATTDLVTVLGSGNVGIGTTTPAALLDVYGTTSSLNFLTGNSTYGGGSIWAGKNNEIGVGYYQNANFTMYLNYSGYLSSNAQYRDLFVGDGKQNNTPILFVDGSAGNVGIGTTGPPSLLSVVSTGGDYTKGILIGYTGQVAAEGLDFWHSGAGNTNEYIESRYDSASAAMNFRMRANGASPVNAVTILGSGNVGIGTTAPLSLLQISGDGSTANYGAATIVNQGIAIAGKTGSANPIGITFGNDINSYGGIYGAFESGADNTLGHIAIAIRKVSTDATFTEIMRIANSGNVGIGTTGPEAALDVRGNFQIYTTNYPTDSATNNLEVYTTDSQAANIGGHVVMGGKYGTSTYAPFAGIAGRKENSTLNNSSGYMALSTMSGSVLSERMRIDSTGNVGIGTASPLAPLSVVAAGVAAQAYEVARFGNGYNSVGLSFGFNQNSPTEPKGYIYNLSATTGTSIEFGFGTTFGSGQVMVLKKEGNVGIGTTSPWSALAVNGTITQTTAKSCAAGLVSDSNGAITGCVASDQSLKTSINPLSITATDLLNQLQPKTYEWRDKSARDGLTHAGFVAQDVEAIFPQAVVGAGIDSSGNLLKGIDASAINSLLVKGFQELDAKSRQMEGLLGVLSVEPGVEAQCVAGDTKLRRRKKAQGAGNLGTEEFDDTPIVDIAVGDEIASLDEQSGRVVYARVNALVALGEQEVYELVTASGRRIRTTGNHPYLVRKG